MNQSSPALTGQQSQFETQRGIDTRLTAAAARLKEAQAAYDRNPSKSNCKALLAADTEFRSLRVPLMSAALDAYFGGA
jgi:hypothetical protein